MFYDSSEGICEPCRLCETGFHMLERLSEITFLTKAEDFYLPHLKCLPFGQDRMPDFHIHATAYLATHYCYHARWCLQPFVYVHFISDSHRTVIFAWGNHLFLWSISKEEPRCHLRWSTGKVCRNRFHINPSLRIWMTGCVRLVLKNPELLHKSFYRRQIRSIFMLQCLRGGEKLQNTPSSLNPERYIVKQGPWGSKKNTA